MAKTLSGFKVIGDTSKIGAGSKKGSAGQTSPTPSSNGSSRTLGGFKVIGDTSKIGAKAAAKTTQQTGAQSATLPQSTTRYPQPMDNVGRQTGTNSRLLADTKQSGTLIPSLDNGRVGKVISGAAKSVGSAYTNLGGVLAEGAGKLNTRIANQNAGGSLQSDHDAVKRYEKMLRDVKWANGRAMSAKDVKQVQGYLASAKRRIAAHEGYTKAVEQSDKAVADKAYQKADRLSQSSAADVAQAKEGLGPVGQFAVDLGVQGVQMAGDVAASAVIPGAGLALMTARSAGSSAQQARQAGATYGQQLAYGLGSGALSLATEKISNVAGPFKKAFGGGVLDNAISGALSKLNNSAAGRVALSMISEGGEEFIEDVFQPILQRATYDPSARFDLRRCMTRRWARPWAASARALTSSDSVEAVRRTHSPRRRYARRCGRVLIPPPPQTPQRARKTPPPVWRRRQTRARQCRSLNGCERVYRGLTAQSRYRPYPPKQSHLSRAEPWLKRQGKCLRPLRGSCLDPALETLTSTGVP